MKKTRGFVFSQTQKVLLCISSILLLLVGAAYLLSLYQKASPAVIIPAARNEAFIAVNDYEKGQVTVTIFSAEKKKVLSTKQIPLDAPLALSSTNSLGSNDAVQYNPATKDIFFSTEGSAAMGGTCLNKDGSCASRLYRIRENEKTPTVIFESENTLRWVVNSFDNSILLSLSETSGRYLTKISGETGKVLFARNLETRDREMLENFVVSADGAYTYQASVERGEKTSTASLRLRKIDNTNGDFTSRDIFTGQVHAETNISPDNRYFAFYADGASIFTPKLYVFDLKNKNQKLTEVSYEGEISNSNLHWSGDSTKVVLILKDGLTSYDLKTKTFTKLPVDSTKPPFVYGWGPTKDFLLFQATDGYVKMFDLKSSASTNILTAHDPSAVPAASWY